MKTYDTVVEALNDLRLRGFTYDFNLKDGSVYSSYKKATIHPDEFHVLETHRFENSSDPADNSVVYAIESPTYGIKGVLVNAFGIYADEVSSELVTKLH